MHTKLLGQERIFSSKTLEQDGFGQLPRKKIAADDGSVGDWLCGK